MVAPPASHARAAFEAELHALARAAADRFAVEAKGSSTWELRAIEPDGFDVRVELTGDAVVVWLGGFRHAEALAGELDDADALDAALDLVAAALWGKIRLQETRVGGRAWRWTAIFVGTEGERTIGTAGGGIFGWRPGATTRDAKNRAAPPVGVSIGEGGRLPTRPWIGVRCAEPDAGPRELPLDGELDLHPFSPKEVKPLVLEYIAACRARGITQLRIVHGKGMGNLRRTVHALLDRHEHVASYRLGGHGEGSWGATIVQLEPIL